MLRMWCTVSFRGNWAPVMEWRGAHMSHPLDSRDVEKQTESNNSVTYIVTIPATSNELPFTCTTKFIASMRPTSTNATNTPNYKFIWTSPASTNVSGDFCILYIIIFILYINFILCRTSKSAVYSWHV